MKTIQIIAGNESVIKTNYSSVKGSTHDDFFTPAYDKAKAQFKEIVDASKDKAIDYSNNIIAFCGERGQGKSTAMITFAQQIKSRFNGDDTLYVVELDKLISGEAKGWQDMRDRSSENIS